MIQATYLDHETIEQIANDGLQDASYKGLLLSDGQPVHVRLMGRWAVIDTPEGAILVNDAGRHTDPLPQGAEIPLPLNAVCSLEEDGSQVSIFSPLGAIPLVVDQLPRTEQRIAISEFVSHLHPHLDTNFDRLLDTLSQADMDVANDKLSRSQVNPTHRPFSEEDLLVLALTADEQANERGHRMQNYVVSRHQKFARGNCVVCGADIRVSQSSHEGALVEGSALRTACRIYATSDPAMRALKIVARYATLLPKKDSMFMENIYPVVLSAICGDSLFPAFAEAAENRMQPLAEFQHEEQLL